MRVSRCKWYLSLCIVGLLFGCAESEPEREKPDSNPETVVVGQTATLTAPDPTSTDDNINPDELIYVWNILAKPTGSIASLTDSDTAHPSFVADFQGTYRFKSSVSYQSELLSEQEIEVVALPQDPVSTKPDDHIDSNEICDACHTPDNWKPARVDHDQVIGPCVSCHQKPMDHIPAINDCRECHDSDSWAADRALYIINHTLWETSNIPSYQFTYRCSCLPDGDLIITVSEGIVTEAFYANTGDMIPEADLADIMTINTLFDVVDESLYSGSMMMVSYNIQYGFPQSVVIGDADSVTHNVIDFQVGILPRVNPDQVQLDENRLLWQQADITNYQYTYHISCFCLPREDIVVVVDAGVVVEAYFTPSGTPLTPAEIQSYNLRTIEQLFDVIQAEINRPAADLTVTYNAMSGYPELISVDPIGQAVDDEYSLSVMDFQEIVVPPENPLQTALDENRVLWQQSNTDQYQYTYRKTCFCLPQDDIVVVVEAGVVVEAYFTPSGTPLTPTEIQSHNLRTVEQLFDVIQAEIDRPAAQLVVTYNATSGYPELISVDPVAQVVDEEYSISVMDFQEVVVPPENLLQTALDENKVLWQQANIANYQYTYHMSCFCLPREDIVVVVDAGVVVEAYFTPSGTALTPAEIQSHNLRTVEQLFDVIQAEIDRPAAQLTVTYNATAGYPELISVDPIGQAVDDEYSLSMMDFQEIVVPPENPLQTALDESRVLWQQADIVYYQYTYNMSCFLCDVQEDIVVVINGGLIVAAYFTPSGTLLTPQQIQANNLGTVEHFFNRIQAEIDRPAAELNVTYNSVSGYPEVITVDPLADLFDDRYTITISDLQRVVVSPPNNPDQASLDENMAKWQQAGLMDYQYTYHISCLCPPNQSVITVRAGVITEAYYVDSGAALTPEQIANLPGINGLFDIIQSAIDRNVPVLDVTYNAAYGYPETIYIDYYSQIIDDEIYHVVTNFQLVN